MFFFSQKYGQLNTLHLLNHNSNLSEIDIQCRTCFCYTMKSTSGFIASSIRSRWEIMMNFILFIAFSKNKGIFYFLNSFRLNFFLENVLNIF